MNRKLFIVVVLIVYSASVFCQLVKCTTVNNEDRSVSIYANSGSTVDYTIRLNFTSLSGYYNSSINSSDLAIVTAQPGYGEVMKLKRENTAVNFSLQYKYQYFPGHSFFKSPDTTRTYLIPAAKGQKVRVTRISTTPSTFPQRAGINATSDYRGTTFVYKIGDTICAARAGVAFECIDTVSQGERQETIFNTNRNRIIVEHRDGTIGVYSFLAPIKSLIKAGDEIIPGQPLAIFNKEAEKYAILFSVCYLDEKKLLSEKSIDNSFSVYYNYITTFFHVGENEAHSILQTGKEFTAEHPATIITDEMTKKEKKKYGF